MPRLKYSKGRKVNPNVRVMVVPGSQQVKPQAQAEGLDRIFTEAGAEWREAGCSMCIAMNGDQLQPGEYSVSTSNRNFEGRQGKGGRTFLASPLTAAATAITGVVTDVRTLLGEQHGEIHHIHQPFGSAGDRQHRYRPDHPGAIPEDNFKEGLGRNCSAIGATTRTGNPKPDFILNRPEGKEAQILLAGDNFGCGSSREHAPWALDAIRFSRGDQHFLRGHLSRQFAEESLLPIVVSPEDPQEVVCRSGANSGATVTVDLAKQTLTLPDGDESDISDRRFREGVHARRRR